MANKCIYVHPNDVTHGGLTTCFDVKHFNGKTNSNSIMNYEKLEEPNSSNLPTIAESLQGDVFSKCQEMLDQNRINATLRRNAVTLPPLFSSMNMHGNAAFPSKRRPSTPRPINTSREAISRNNQRSRNTREPLRCGTKENIHHLNIPERDLNENVSYKNSENDPFPEAEDLDRCFPLFSVSPVETKCSTKEDAPLPSPLLKRLCISETKLCSRPLLQRGKISPGECLLESEITKGTMKRPPNARQVVSSWTN